MNKEKLNLISKLWEEKKINSMEAFTLRIFLSMEEYEKESKKKLTFESLLEMCLK